MVGEGLHAVNDSDSLPGVCAVPSRLVLLLRSFATAERVRPVRCRWWTASL